ncbi:MAG: alpha/beta hydrolase [Cyclobacteriaceae bacterium]
MPYVQANGIQLFYEERGTGDPLLLIMGITAPGSVWEKHVASWEQQFRCIFFDNRGVGLSDKPAGPYTTAQMGDDCAGLLEALDIPIARVAGVSMGSTIAMQLALRHPDKVSAMVLMCPWARCDRKGEAVFRHMMHAKRLRPEEFSNFIQQLIYHKSSWDDDAVYQDLMQSQQAEASNPFPQPLHGLEGQAHACIQHQVLAELPSIEQPCLVIGGKEDQFIPAWMAQEVAAAIPDSTLHLYDEAGHAFHWEKIEDFNPRVLKWLIEHGD